MKLSQKISRSEGVDKYLSCRDDGNVFQLMFIKMTCGSETAKIHIQLLKSSNLNIKKKSIFYFHFNSWMPG